MITEGQIHRLLKLHHESLFAGGGEPKYYDIKKRRFKNYRDKMIKQTKKNNAPDIQIKIPTEIGMYYYRSPLFVREEFRLIKVTKDADGRLYGDAVTGTMRMYKPVTRFQGIFEGPIAPPSQKFMQKKVK